MTRTSTIILFCFNILLSSPFQPGEKLEYSAGFRLFSAGIATLEITLDTLGMDSVFKIYAETNTNSFFDRLYKVRDKVTAWMDPLNFELLKVDKKVSEGRYKRNHFATVNRGDSTIITSKNIKKIDAPVFDPISIVYLLRDKIKKITGMKEVYVYDLGKIRKVLFKITGQEKIRVPYGIFDCFIVEPVSRDNKPLLKNKGQMKVWYSDDELRLPVRIEQVTNIGTMVMELKSVSR